MKILGEEGQNQQIQESQKNDYQQEGSRQNNNYNNENNISRRTVQNDYRSQNLNNNQSQNNIWNNRRGNQQPRDNRQQINQVITTEDKNEQAIVPHTINQMQGVDESFSPYVKCIIEGEVVELLVDTGASISVLTKDIVDIITKKDPTVPQLAIKGVRISNAVGKEFCKTSKKIFCKCQIDQAIFHADFIQVERLNEHGIIGADILYQHHAQINFKNRTIQLRINEQSYSIPFSKKLPKQIIQEEDLQEVDVMEQTEEVVDHQLTINPIEQEKFNMTMGKYQEARNRLEVPQSAEHQPTLVSNVTSTLLSRPTNPPSFSNLVPITLGPSNRELKRKRYKMQQAAKRQQKRNQRLLTDLSKKPDLSK